MVSVRINGEDAPIKSDGLGKVTDLIELIKSVIDPDHMITGILIDGRELEDGDWVAALSGFQTSIVEVDTGLPSDYVATRLANAGSIVKACYYEFRESRKLFQEGKSAEGNKMLLEGVNALQAFFEWYGTLMDLLSEADREEFSIESYVRELTTVCKTICQQQLYQSWWALGETIEKELEPRLDQLESHCRTFGVLPQVAQG